MNYKTFYESLKPEVFNLNSNFLKNAYEYNKYRYIYTLEILSKHIELNNKKVLDVGSFPFVLTYALYKLGNEVHSLDEQLAFLEDNWYGKIEPWFPLDIQIGNIEKDEIKENNFDVIVLTEVIEHLVANPVRILKKLQDALKPSGILITTTPNSTRLPRRIKFLLGKNIESKLEQFYSPESKQLTDPIIYHRHQREYVMDELRLIHEHAGFDILESKHIEAYPYIVDRQWEPHFNKKGKLNKFAKFVNYCLVQTHPTFKDNLYVVAQKPIE